MLIFLIFSSQGADHRRRVDVFLFAHCFAEILGSKIHILFLENRLTQVFCPFTKKHSAQLQYQVQFYGNNIVRA